MIKWILVLFLVLNAGWYSPRTTSGLTASQDVLAASTDQHNVGTSGNSWYHGFFRRLFFKESTTAATAVSGFGQIYFKSSDSLPYAVDDSGTEYALTGTSPSNLRTVSAKTASYDVSLSDSGNILTNLGASTSVDFTLPTITQGMNYTFVVLENKGVTIRPQSGTRIDLDRNVSGDLVTATASKDRIMAASQGDAVVLTGVSGDQWTVISQEGIGWKDFD